MLLLILRRHLLSLLPQILLKRRIDDQLLVDKITSQLSRKLILSSRNFVVVLNVKNVLIVKLDLAMIFRDDVDDDELG